MDVELSFLRLCGEFLDKRDNVIYVLRWRRKFIKAVDGFAVVLKKLLQDQVRGDENSNDNEVHQHLSNERDTICVIFITVKPCKCVVFFS